MHAFCSTGVCLFKAWAVLASVYVDFMSDLQAYEERRRKKDADREAAEAAQEAELARAAAAR